MFGEGSLMIGSCCGVYSQDGRAETAAESGLSRVVEQAAAQKVARAGGTAGATTAGRRWRNGPGQVVDQSRSDGPLSGLRGWGRRRRLGSAVAVEAAACD